MGIGGPLRCVFICILKGLFCIGEGTKTWGHGPEQAILSGQLLGYLYWLVLGEKRNRLTCWFFSHFFAGLWVYFWNIETPRPTFLQSCKYDEFRSLFYVAKKYRCDTYSYDEKCI